MTENLLYYGICAFIGFILYLVARRKKYEMPKFILFSLVLGLPLIWLSQYAYVEWFSSMGTEGTFKRMVEGPKKYTEYLKGLDVRFAFPKLYDWIDRAVILFILSTILWFISIFYMVRHLTSVFSGARGPCAR